MKPIAAAAFLLVVLAFGACGGSAREDGATATTAISTGSTDTPAKAPTPGAAATGATTSQCSSQRPSNCVYLSRDLEYVEREGLATEDPVTGRRLPLLVRLPKGLTGPAAVVIFMHGGGFNDTGHKTSDSWGDMLARHGYVVIHVASSSLTQEAGRKMCALARVPERECVAGDEDANGLLMVFRGFDLAAVLNDLPRLSELSTGNGGPALDLKRVAVGGWSGGSRAPALIMGASVKPTASAPVYRKPHNGAAVGFAMSPAGPPFGGLYAEAGDTSWDDMRGPFFTATGTNDQKPLKPELTGAIRRRFYDEQPRDGERWLLYSNLPVGVGGHGTYNLEDLDSKDERVRRLSEAIGSATRAFLDAELRDDAAARAWLASDNARVLAGDVDWEHR